MTFLPQDGVYSGSPHISHDRTGWPVSLCPTALPLLRLTCSQLAQANCDVPLRTKPKQPMQLATSARQVLLSQFACLATTISSLSPTHLHGALFTRVWLPNVASYTPAWQCRASSTRNPLGKLLQEPPNSSCMHIQSRDFRPAQATTPASSNPPG